MSYIRCLSNPEGLYAFGCKSDNIPSRCIVQLCVRHDYKFTNLVDSELLTVPIGVFFGAVIRSARASENVRHRGFVAKEVHVFTDTGEPVTADWDAHEDWSKAEAEGREPRDSRYAIRIEYKGKWMLLWRVTWRYLVENALPDALKYENPRRRGFAWWFPERSSKASQKRRQLTKDRLSVKQK